MAKLSKVERVNLILEKIKGKVTVDENGVGTVEKGAIAEALPEGITEASITAHDEAKSDMAAAVAIEFGSLTKKVFDNNKELEQASLKAGIGKHSQIRVLQKREAKFNNLKNPDEKIVRQGYISTSLTQYASLNNNDIMDHDKVKKVWGGLSD